MYRRLSFAGRAFDNAAWTGSSGMETDETRSGWACACTTLWRAHLPHFWYSAVHLRFLLHYFSPVCALFCYHLQRIAC